MRRAHWLAARRVAAGVLLGALLGASGCLTVGREFPTKPVPSIQIGETTRDQVYQTFGEPWRRGLEDGQRTWTYGHYRYSVLGASQTRDLVVRFDAEGRVASYSFNSTVPDDL